MSGKHDLFPGWIAHSMLFHVVQFVHMLEVFLYIFVLFVGRGELSWHITSHLRDELWL